MSKNDFEKNEFDRRTKNIAFAKHCVKHPKDVLRLGKATVLYGTKGLKARAGELARKDLEKQKHGISIKEEDMAGNLSNAIKFSIIMPVYNVDIKWLKKAIDSVYCQTYKCWELCIADDASDNEKIRNFLKSVTDERVKIKFLKNNQGISGASNEAAAMATGEYLVLMDNDDELDSHALFELYRNVRKTDADIVYTDMDMIDAEGVHSAPLYKPNWSPELFLTQMYIGHLVAFKRTIFEKVGGFRKEYDGAQDYDLILRMSEWTNKISHVPKVLYSWRTLPSSTAANADSKPYAQTAGQNALQAHLDRLLGRGKAVVDETDNLCVYDSRYQLKKEPLVSIIIPTKDHVGDLKVALDSIFSITQYSNFEIIILNNNSQEEETWQYFETLQKEHDNVHVIEANYEFNWSKLNNQGIEHAKGDVFVFLNNDIKVLEPTWLRRLVEYAVQPQIGIVGGLLLYEDGTIQHAGVVIGMGGWADHVFKGMKPVHCGTPFISPMVTRNVSACTGACMAVSKEMIEIIGKFDERFIICGSDVEICLRAMDYGYRNVYIPQVKLIHYESKSRDSYIPKIDFQLSDIMYDGYRRGGDPYYNSNLSMSNCIPEVSSMKQTTQKPEEVLNVDISTIRELRFRYVENRKCCLNLVLPSINEEHVFGGISTALKCFETLGKELGWSTRIIIIDAKPDQKARDNFGQRYSFVSSKENSEEEHQIVDVVNRNRKTLAVSLNDWFMFTSWWSAYIIQNEYKRFERQIGVAPNPFLYLIQDFEPGFYSWSSGHVLAESTYRCAYPQIAIFNSHELKEFITKKGYFFKSIYSFEPILNSVLKKYVKTLDSTIYKRKQILVYGRPSVARNAFEIVVESLRKWVSIQVDAGSWTILSAGEQHKPVYLGEGLYLNSVGKLSIDEYAKVLMESYAGISLMVSPHPSYPPLEMSAFDVKVVTNSYDNKDISGFSDNIVSVDNVSPISVATALNKICDNFQIVVDHKPVNEDYANSDNLFPFINDLKNEILK